MKVVLSSCENSRSDIYSDGRLPDLECVDHVVLLSEDPSKLQIFIGRRHGWATIFGMRSASPKCKVLRSTSLARAHILFLRRVKWIGSCISSDGQIWD